MGGWQWRSREIRPGRGTRFCTLAPPSMPATTSSESASELLHRVFGFESFRSHQEAIIDRVSAGGDAIVVMPTGSGKSLCFQIPAMLRSGTGIVVSPLIALMDDQVTALEQLGVRAARLHSGLDEAESDRKSVV